MKISSARGAGFEREMQAVFMAYANAGLAYLDILPVPTVPCGRKTEFGVPLFIRSGASPFDVMGYTADGRVVGIEIKETRNREARLNISDGGIRPHQLAALGQLVRCGGIGIVVWDNGGEIGVLGPQQIMVADTNYSVSLASEVSKQTNIPGARSIRWEVFKPVRNINLGGLVVPHVLEGYISPQEKKTSPAPIPSHEEEAARVAVIRARNRVKKELNHLRSKLRPAEMDHVICSMRRIANRLKITLIQEEISRPLSPQPPSEAEGAAGSEG